MLFKKTIMKTKTSIILNIYIYKIVIDRLCSYFTDATKTYKDGV